MQIVANSKVVLQEIYQLLDNDSYTLVVQIPMDTVADKLKISKEHLNLCVHYLIECGYLKGDFAFNRNNNSTKEVTVLPSAIDKCEHASL